VQFQAQVDEQNAHVYVYLFNMDAYMDEVAVDIAANESQLVADVAVATNTLNVFDAKLVDLEANVAAHTPTITGLLTDQAGYLSSFLVDFVAKRTELDTNYSLHLTLMESLLQDADTDLATFATRQAVLLIELEAAYTAHVTEIDALLATAAAYMAQIETDINTILTQLVSDWDTHAIVATAFLDNLGVTELARIHEAYNATLSTQLQLLVDRGLYSGALAVDVTARNSRDRSEEIGILNDRLMREKWENQHKLYGQQQSMRDRILAGKQAIYAIKDAVNRLNIEVRTTLYRAGQEMRQVLIEEAARLQQLSQAVTQWKAGSRDRLLEQIQQVVTQHMAGLDRQHTAQQEVSRVAMGQRDTLLGQLQDAVKGFLGGKERFAAMTMTNASTLADHRHRMLVEKMNMFAVRLAGLNEKNAENMKLMAYQLDERNKLMIGLYGFVERRDDVGPSINDLAKITTGLGDAGGGWITP
jgi:hypothetical protein